LILICFSVSVSPKDPVSSDVQSTVGLIDTVGVVLGGVLGAVVVVGRLLGEDDGFCDGVELVNKLGNQVGALDGTWLGELDGSSLSKSVGCEDCVIVGDKLRPMRGDEVGVTDGVEVG
jgi:hypothetical protein